MIIVSTDVALKASQAYKDIQTVFSEHKVVAYMCQYLSKTEDQCSQAMKQTAKEAFESNIHDPARVLLRRQLALFCQNLNQRIFLAVPFVITNLPE